VDAIAYGRVDQLRGRQFPAMARSQNGLVAGWCGRRRAVVVAPGWAQVVTE